MIGAAAAGESYYRTSKYADSGGSRAAHYKVSELGYGTDNEIPRTFSRLMKRKDFGDFVDYGYTPTHNLRTKRGRRNRDWRNSMTGEQYVFDMFGALVVDVANHGTYDSASPENGLWKHYKENAEPWVRWGNGPDDPTTPDERLRALLRTLAYGAYWKMLPERIRNKKTQRWIESVTR